MKSKFWLADYFSSEAFESLFVFLYFLQLTKEQRAWLIMAATSDYHPMAKMLNTNPSLAKMKVGFISVSTPYESTLCLSVVWLM